MPVKILCAGFSKDERAALEADVKPVMASRPREESWTISVVKTGRRLAVTVDGPDERIRGQNFVAERPQLRTSLTELLGRYGFSVSATSTPPVMTRPRPASTDAVPARFAPPPSHHRGGGFSPADEVEEEWEAPVAGERRDTHRCTTCERAFVVTYVALPNEPRETVAVACPHCWRVDRVEVGQNAALAKEYRADKVQA